MPCTVPLMFGFGNVISLLSRERVSQVVKLSGLVVIVLGLLMIVALGSDWIMTTFTTRKAGASWKATTAALVGGVTGGIAFTILPVLGTILGTILGATAGVLVVEYVGKRDWRLAIRSAAGYTLGLLASSVLQMILCLLMVAIFAWQAFF